MDRYAILEDVASRADLSQIMVSTSTEDNSDLRDYLGQNVFLVKKSPGPAHHLLELPAHVVISERGSCEMTFGRPSARTRRQRAGRRRLPSLTGASLASPN